MKKPFINTVFAIYLLAAGAVSYFVAGPFVAGNVLHAAEDAPKLSDSEKLHLRELQVKQLRIQNAMAQAAQAYNDGARQLEAANQELQQATQAALKAHNCPDCTIQDDLTMVKPAKPEEEKKKP